MISSLLISLALCSPMVPGGAPVANHAHPGHFARPMIRVFERGGEDRDRRIAWEAYCQELDELWIAYRAAGSTPAAWRTYLDRAGQAKRRYVERDLYLVPIYTPIGGR